MNNDLLKFIAIITATAILFYGIGCMTNPCNVQLVAPRDTIYLHTRDTLNMDSMIATETFLRNNTDNLADLNSELTNSNYNLKNENKKLHAKIDSFVLAPVNLEHKIILSKLDSLRHRYNLHGAADDSKNIQRP